jgi:hypothetical protein
MHLGAFAFVYKSISRSRLNKSYIQQNISLAKFFNNSITFLQQVSCWSIKPLSNIKTRKLNFLLPIMGSH